MLQPDPTSSLPERQETGANSAPVFLYGLSRNALAEALEALGEKPFRAKQLWNWVQARGATDFEQMHNIPKTLRKKLSEQFSLQRPLVAREHASADGTYKWLLNFTDGNQVETVYIPEEDRGTLCISSQVGCTLSCTFCHTGTQALVRNLRPHELVGQVLLAKDRLQDWNAKGAERKVTNIVLMGMGEPLFNYEHVASAMRILLDNEGMDFSKRKITLSTSGVVPMMQRCAEELGLSLAVSLHATNDTLRDEIVPLNKKYPIAELLQACRDYSAKTPSRRITFEYVMLAGVNDSDAEARALVKLLKGIPAKVNLIPFNKWCGSQYERSSNARIRSFATIVNDAGLACPVRATRGDDIYAACGQLKSESERTGKVQLQ